METNNHFSSTNNVSNTVHGNNQHSAGHNMRNTHTHENDPFKVYGSDSGANSRKSSGFFMNWLLHKQIQNYEIEIQYLNSSKVDIAGTSVGVSDTRMRFLSLAASGVVLASLFSLLLMFVIFLGSYLYLGTLVAYLLGFAILLHGSFPGYIAYGMKKFVLGEKFTGQFYKKVLGAWHGFEVCYLGFIGIVYSFSILDWNLFKESLLSKLVGSSTIKQYLFKLVNPLDFSKAELLFEHMVICLLCFFIVYAFSMYLVNKKSSINQKELSFEHAKENKNAFDLARMKAGRK